MDPCLDRTQLTDLATRLLEGAGCSNEHAVTTADCLVEADVRGIETHGLSRLPIYLERIRKGLISVKAEPAIEKRAGAVASVDGRNCLGPVVGTHAMLEAVALAQENGIGFVTANASNHFGIAAYYSTMASSVGQVGIVGSNTAPVLAAFNGDTPVLGTNPLSISAPGGSYTPMVLDMSMGATTVGRLKVAAAAGQDVPLGLGVDVLGAASTNPVRILEGGAILPFGGAKGYGLAVAIELLSGVLSGGGSGESVRSIYGDMTSPNNCSHFFLCIDISYLMPLGRYAELVDQLYQQVTGREHHSGESDGGILMPGEPEWRRRAENLATGVPLSEPLMRQLEAEAALYGVQIPWD